MEGRGEGRGRGRDERGVVRAVDCERVCVWVYGCVRRDVVGKWKGIGSVTDGVRRDGAMEGVERACSGGDEFTRMMGDANMADGQRALFDGGDVHGGGSARCSSHRNSTPSDTLVP